MIRASVDETWDATGTADMTSEVDWKTQADALIHRFKDDRTEAWHEEAHDIAVQLVTCLGTANGSVPRIEELLQRAAELPARASSADSLRRILIRYWISLTEDGHSSLLEPGCRIIGVHGNLGIATESTDPPSQRWMAMQDYRLPRAAGPTDWWTALTFNGGAILVRADVTPNLGRPTDDQLWELVEHAGEHGAAVVAELFPHLAAQARARR